MGTLIGASANIVMAGIAHEADSTSRFHNSSRLVSAMDLAAVSVCYVHVGRRCVTE